VRFLVVCDTIARYGLSLIDALCTSSCASRWGRRCSVAARQRRRFSYAGGRWRQAISSACNERIAAFQRPLAGATRPRPRRGGARRLPGPLPPPPVTQRLRRLRRQPAARRPRPPRPLGARRAAGRPHQNQGTSRRWSSGSSQLSQAPTSSGQCGAQGGGGGEWRLRPCATLKTATEVCLICIIGIMCIIGIVIVNDVLAFCAARRGGIMV